jgi:hypothetical protein
MKKLLLLAFAFISCSVIAQPSITSTSFNSYSDVGALYYASSSSIGFGAAGANQTWDFSSLVLGDDGNYSRFAVATAPYSNEFANANFFIKNTNVGFEDIYDIYTINSAKLDILGLTRDSGTYLIYTNPRTVYVFPFNYTNSFSDTYQILGESLINITITYDGYGTLITPFGTFPNVARIKTEDGDNVFYTWATTSPYREIVLASTGDNGETFYSIKNNSNLDSGFNQTVNKFTIAPNPFSTDFNVNFNNDLQGTYSIDVYDLLGNAIIRKQKMERSSNNISFPEVASGLYLITISDDQNKVIATQKLIKN